jgi:hypothetical protein
VPKTAPPPEPPPRRFATLPLAQLLPAVTRAASKKRSPAGATLMANWATIVGPHLAAVTQPRRLARGTLTIACAGPVAMELQHLQDAVLARINTHAGERLVERLRFTQDHIAAPTPPATKRRAVLRQPVEGIPEGPLAEALAGLLQAIQERQP